MGKLLVIEGVDSSGKATQAKKLLENLKNIGYDVQSVEFPDYKSNSSALVKMYLGGEFGKNAEDVNPYSASAFFAVDRVASYLTNWKKSLDDGKIVLADRYTTSNFIHQAAKFRTKWKRTNFSTGCPILSITSSDCRNPTLRFSSICPCRTQKCLWRTARTR